MRYVVGAAWVALALVGCGSAQGAGNQPGAGAGGGLSVGGSAQSAGSGGNAGNPAGGATVNGVAGTVGGSGIAGAASSGDDPILPNSIAAGSDGTCAIGRAGKLECWGKADPAFAWILPQGTFQAVALESLGCARNTVGEISCFLVPGTSDDVTIAPTGSSFASFDVGISTMCALDAAGTPTCNEPSGPKKLAGAPAGVKFSRIAVGRDFACGIRRDSRQLACWGFEGSDGACSTVPKTGQLLAPSGEFVELASAYAQSCAIRTDQTVACWGAGDASDDPNQMFCNEKINFGQSVAPPGTFVQISVGTLNSCGVHTDGTVACWGAGTKPGDCSSDIDTCGQSLPPAGKFVQVAAGYSHACGMKADRTVECWGSKTNGRGTPPADFP
ncbi:MAG TPA: hypothetical protein VGF76_22625 [Polyangiaceae bacterium]